MKSCILTHTSHPHTQTIIILTRVRQLEHDALVPLGLGI